MLIFLITPLSCAKMTGGKGIEFVDFDERIIAGCDGFKPITWSQNDTDETIIQVKQHNAIMSNFCGVSNDEEHF